MLWAISAMDIYMDRIYRDDSKSERIKKYAEQAGEQAKAGNWSALDAMIDEMGQYNQPSAAIGYYHSAGSYQTPGHAADGTLQKRNANGQLIPFGNSSGNGSSGGSSGGSGGSGSVTPGSTPLLNSISSLFNIGGALADTGQAVAATTVNLITVLINGIKNIFH